MVRILLHGIYVGGPPFQETLMSVLRNHRTKTLDLDKNPNLKPSYQSLGNHGKGNPATTLRP